MSKRESISRYNLIIKKLRKQPASFRQISEFLAYESELQSYNFNVSKRTFQRDIEDISSIYNIEIQFDFSRKVYFIAFEQEQDANERILEAFDTFNALNITDRISDYIHFEKRRSKGTENLYGLLHAIKNRFVISFTYHIAAPQMGMVASSVLTMKVIHSFRPRFIVMTGIAAGVKSKSNYGDLLITELSFDYTSGKQKSDKTKNIVFEPDYKTIELSRELLEEVQISKAKREFLDEIKNAWPGNKPPTSLEIHIGPLGSGGGVIADDSVLKNIQYHSRKLIGLDMETYGLYYACNNSSKPKPSGFISIKSVSDFSGIRKNDKFQKYASYTSATFAYKFFMEKIL